MAKKFLTGLTLVNLDSDPLVGSEGELYFNTSASVAKIYKSGSWAEIGGGSGVTIVSTTPPNSPQVGSTWFNNEDGSFYVYDGTFWVEVNTVIENAPISQEEIQDYVAPLLNHLNHTNISASYDDANNQILLSASASFTTEEIQDAIAPLFEHSNHTNISASYDDLNNQILLSASASSTGAGIIISTTAPENPEVGTGWYNNETGVFAVYDGTYWIEVNGVIENNITQEEVQDYVSPLFIHNNHTNVVATYDDENNQILLNTSASITNIDSIVYPDYIVFDTAPETSSASVGTVYWGSGDGLPKVVLSATTELGLGQESVALVKNSTGSTISKGKVVYINGAQGQRPTIALASSDSESTSSKTFGFVAEEILDEAEGFLVTEGILRGLNTDGLTEGGAVWLSSSGNYTQTMPTQPDHGVFLGYVVKANASSGEIFVKIQNGYELNELHNVLITSASIQNNHLLAYDSASGLWKNKAAYEVDLLTLSTASSSDQIILASQIFG